MTTKFELDQIHVPIPGGGQYTFWFDGNSKITLGGGSFDQPVANAFSLVQIEDCPFSTLTCESVCYVHKLEENESMVHDKYRNNSKAIRAVINDPVNAVIAAAYFADYVKHHCSYGFRWHVSGDIFSEVYAIFIRMVAKLSKPTLNWIYTRSFKYVPHLIGLDNLIVNLSVDQDNWGEALKLHHEFGLRLCYLTVDGKIPDDLPEGSVIFPSYELRGADLPKPTDSPWWKSLSIEQKRMVCPPDFFGQSEKFRCGPCRKCLI